MAEYTGTPWPAYAMTKRMHKVPQETESQNDFALTHSIVDVCTLFSHFKTDLPWSLKDLKLLSRVCCENNSNQRYPTAFITCLMLIKLHAI